MAFSELNGIITQTGTDTNLSGMVGLPGVTVMTSGGKTVFDLSGPRIDVTGELTIDPDIEVLLISAWPTLTSTQGVLNVLADATLNVGVDRSVVGGERWMSPGTAILSGLAAPSGSAVCCGPGHIIYSQPGSLVRILGATINTTSYFKLTGSVFIRDAVLLSSAGVQFRFDAVDPAQVIDIDGITYTRWTVLPNGPSTGGSVVMAGLRPVGTSGGINLSSGGSVSRPQAEKPWLELPGFSDADVSGTVLRFWRANRGTIVLNGVRGMAVKLPSLAPHANTYGAVESRQDYYPVIADLDGVPVEGATVRRPHYPMAPPVPAADSAFHMVDWDTEVEAVSVVTGADGVASFPRTLLRVVNKVQDQQGTIHWCNNTGDNSGGISLGVASYGHNLSQANLGSTGGEAIAPTVSLFPDLLITEPDRAVVDARPTHETPLEAYDALKSWLVDNYAGEGTTVVSRTSTSLISPDPIVLDPLAAVGRAGGVVTIPTGSWSGSVDAPQLTLEGVTIADGTFGPVTQNGAVTSYSGVETASLTIAADPGGPVTLTNCDILSVENTSGVPVEVVLAGSTIPSSLVETAGAITLVNDMAVTFTDLDPLSSLLVEDQSGALVEYHANPAGDVVVTIPRAAHGQVWRWANKRPGYEATTGTFTVAEGTTLEIPMSYTEILTPQGPPMYTGDTDPLVSVDIDFATPQASIDIGNGSPSLEAVFSTAENALATEPGLRWIARNGGRVATFKSVGGNFLFLSTNWRLRRRAPGDTNATAPAFTLSTDGIPIDDVNGPIAFLTSDTPQVLAAAVRAELAVELARLDVAVSTRQAETDAATRADTIDAAIEALNDITTADVRTELATELGRLDVAVSTREAEDQAELRATQAANDRTAKADAVAASLTAISGNLAQLDTHTVADITDALEPQLTAISDGLITTTDVRTELTTELEAVEAIHLLARADEVRADGAHRWLVEGTTTELMAKTYTPGPGDEDASLTGTPLPPEPEPEPEPEPVTGLNGAGDLTITRIDTSDGTPIEVQWPDGTTTTVTSGGTASATGQPTGPTIFTTTSAVTRFEGSGPWSFTMSELAVVFPDLQRLAMLSGNTTSGDIGDLPTSLTYYNNQGSNATSGDIGGLPANLTTYVNTGSNATSGDIGGLPTGLTYYLNTGSNTTSGDIGGLPANLTTYVNQGSNTTSGDIGGLPANLTTYDNQGSNTTSGDIGDLPTGLTYYLNQGSNATSGDIGGLPTGLTYYLNQGSNATSGDIGGLPANLTTYVNTGSNATSGDIGGLPTGLTYYLNTGSNTTSGDIGGLPANLTTYDNQGSNTTSGDIGGLPTGLTYYNNTGSNATSGDIGGLPTSLTYYNNTGSNATTYSGGYSFAALTRRFTNQGTGMTSPEIDQLLIDIAAAGVTPTTDKRIDLAGANQPRTTASDNAVATLQAAGWTVTTN